MHEDANKDLARETNWFGSRLRHLRKQRALLQSDLGELSGIHFSRISRYERGVSHPTAETLKRLAQALKVSVAHLIEESYLDIEGTELHQQLQEIASLPEHDRFIVQRILGTLLSAKKSKNAQTSGIKMRDIKIDTYISL